MTALIEFKQKLKNLYGRYEVYLLPILKFATAMVFFTWINQNLGYMTRLDNIFVVLVLALVSSILPTGVMAFFGFILVIGHCYAICMEAGAFALVLILFLSLLFLRFSGGQNLALVCAPLGFAFEIPVLLPIGSGLLGNAFSVFPAVSGVILYYFVRMMRTLADTLSGELDALSRVRLMADGMIQNWAMWLTVLAVLVTILMVNLIRTRSFDYSWRVSIVTGGITYVLVMVIGGSFLQVIISPVPLAVQTIISVLIGLLIEFVFFGGDYSRTERLQYEDDEYYYFVKAVPKSSVAASERKIKKITAVSEEPEEPARPTDSTQQQKDSDAEEPGQGVDFERKLEESLKDL